MTDICNGCACRKECKQLTEEEYQEQREVCYGKQEDIENGK